jgi:hypothetical protein
VEAACAASPGARRSRRRGDGLEAEADGRPGSPEATLPGGHAPPDLRCRSLGKEEEENVVGRRRLDLSQLASAPAWKSCACTRQTRSRVS